LPGLGSRHRSRGPHRTGAHRVRGQSAAWPSPSPTSPVPGTCASARW
jgi:hypothetical protein